MTYCRESTELLAKAGETLAKSLLPEPFQLWFSNHDTGCQMTVVALTEVGSMPVWRGSIWRSSIYEFNDRGHVPGLQPDFEFARDVIDKYFDDVRAAVNARKALHEQQLRERGEAYEARRLQSISAIRDSLNVAPHVAGGGQ